MCLWEGGNPGKRAQDCSSAPFRERAWEWFESTGTLCCECPLTFCTGICLLLKLEAWTQHPDGWGPLQNHDSWTWDLVVYFFKLPCFLMLIIAARLPSKHLLRAGFWIKAPLWLGLLETIHASHRILDNLHEYCIVWEQEQSRIG